MRALRIDHARPIGFRSSDSPPRGALRGLAVAARAGRRALERDAAEDALRHQLVDQADLERLGGAFGLAGQDDVERGADPDEPGQALATARAGKDADLHLGKPDDGLGRVGGDPPGAGERQLAPQADTGAVNRHHDRLGEALQPIDHLLPGAGPAPLPRRRW